jgi:hypothetical protein
MARPKKKVLVDRVITSLELDDLNGTIPAIVHMLLDYRSNLEHPHGEWSSVRLSIEQHFDEVHVNLIGDRDETDVEYQKRTKRRRAYLKSRRVERRG